jgi:Big-like domain-containing protein/beta-propeller repeat-containing protein
MKRIESGRWPFAFELRVFFGIALLLWVAAPAQSAPPATVRPVSGSTAKVEALLDRLPLAFEANSGQFDRRVKFLARGPRQRAFVTSEGLVLALQGDRRTGTSSVLRLQLEGANKGAELRGVERLETVSNYFHGNDPGRYITNVPNFSRVMQPGIYPGVDLAYYGNRRRLEYDFIVSPGADVGRIKLRLRGHDSARLSKSGDLVITTKAGELVLKKPSAYQDRDGQRIEVAAAYALKGNRVTFDVGAYDAEFALVIDPMVAYSTLVGGSGNDYGYAIAVGADGSVYIVGQTSSSDFPVVSAFQSGLSSVSAIDAFVAKLNPSGTGLVYATYLGGRGGNSQAGGIALDAAGNAYVAGQTASSRFPVTAGAYQTTFISNEGFITKLGPQGNTLVYSTFVHGVNNTARFPITVDTSGNAIFTGFSSASFVTTPGAFQPVAAGGHDVFVLKLNAAGSAAVYATLLGGSGTDEGESVAADSAGNAYITGRTDSVNFPLLNALQTVRKGFQDAFITKFNASGALVYSTYLGGSDQETGWGVAVDSQGNAYVTGTTHSSDFPAVRAQSAVMPSFSPFIAKLNASGNGLLYSGTLVANGAAILGEPSPSGIALDGAGNAYVAGNAYFTVSRFPEVDPVVVDLTNTGESLPFVAKVQELDQIVLTYSTLFGVPGQTVHDTFAWGIAVDASGNAYVAGQVSSPLFPTTQGAFQHTVRAEDAFVFKLSPGTRFPTKVSSSPLSPTSSDSITLRAAVTNTAPGGTVTFSSDGSLLGTVAVSGGGATLNLSLPAGVHQITAVYSGDGKVSQPLFLPVQHAPVCN